MQTPNQHHDTLTPAGNPLPDAVHLTVLSTDAEDEGADDEDDESGAVDAADAATKIRWLNPRGRLVVVGDVHGCLGALNRLLAKIDFADGVDNLVLCGDVVTKGPDSKGVVERAMALGALCARGNHDDLALAAAAAQEQQQQQQQQPSPDFVPSLQEKHLRWLASLPFTIRFPEYRLIAAHAGLVPGVPRRRQALRDVTAMRELVAVGGGDGGGGGGHRQRQHHVVWRAVEQHEPGSVPWAPEWRGPGHALFGHDATRGVQRARGATGLDTGCVYGGRLTCAVLPPLEEFRRRERRGWSWWWWWSFWRCWGWGGLAKEEAPLQLPRTPRFERDLRGAIVSVPAADDGGLFR